MSIVVAYGRKDKEVVYYDDTLGYNEGDFYLLIEQFFEQVWNSLKTKENHKLL